ncbi:MAG: hypothetical protein ACRDAU_05885 [Clostridium sp.]
MRQRAVMIGICIIGVIILLIISVVMIFNKPDLRVQKNNNKLIVQLGNEKQISINMKDVENIEYLKKYSLSNENNIDKSKGKNDIFKLYNKNIKVISMSNKGSGIYIETPNENYLISTNDSNETHELYRRIEDGENIDIKYIGDL